MNLASKGPLPPHGQFREFLPIADMTALLDWTLANEQRFRAARTTDRTGQASTEAPGERIALKLRDLGPLAGILRDRLLAALPAAMEAGGSSGTEPRSLELELTAYGDGAFYAPHVDIPLGPDRRSLGAAAGEDRMLSAVYYFHREPKGFSGGQLRLHRFGSSPGDEGEAGIDHVDIEPIANSLAVFPSWVRHEVRPVTCPSGRFADYRFALNCWYCRPLS